MREIRPSFIDEFTKNNKSVSGIGHFSRKLFIENSWLSSEMDRATLKKSILELIFFFRIEGLLKKMSGGLAVKLYHRTKAKIIARLIIALAGKECKMRVLQTINGCITYFSQKREISDMKFDKIIQLLKTAIIGAVMMTAICTQGIHGLFFSTVIAAGVGIGWLIKKMEV